MIEDVKPAPGKRGLDPDGVADGSQYVDGPRLQAAVVANAMVQVVAGEAVSEHDAVGYVLDVLERGPRLRLRRRGGAASRLNGALAVSRRPALHPPHGCRWAVSVEIDATLRRAEPRPTTSASGLHKRTMAVVTQGLLHAISIAFT